MSKSQCEHYVFDASLFQCQLFISMLSEMPPTVTFQTPPLPTKLITLCHHYLVSLYPWYRLSPRKLVWLWDQQPRTINSPIENPSLTPSIKLAIYGQSYHENYLSYRETCLVCCGTGIQGRKLGQEGEQVRRINDQSASQKH